MKHALVRYFPGDRVPSTDVAGLVLQRFQAPEVTTAGSWVAVAHALIPHSVAPASIGQRFAASRQAGIRSAWLSGALAGQRCLAVGVNLVFGPDLRLGVLSEDPDAVTALGRAWAMGLIASGVTPALAPFPGMPAQTALTTAVSDSLGDLILGAVVPVRELATLTPFAIAADVPYTDIASDDLDQSTSGIDWAKTVTGFSGTLIGRGPGAIAAGCDWAICDAADLGALKDENPVAAKPSTPRLLDSAALEQELSALMSQA